MSRAFVPKPRTNAASSSAAGAAPSPVSAEDLARADVLADLPADKQRDTLTLLEQLNTAHPHSVEILWRLARACYDVADLEV
jgi:hypothetical protein